MLFRSLDHAAAKMGYGGKLGIDATRKLPEEIIPTSKLEGNLGNPALKVEDYPEIHALNTSFIDQGISLVVCAVKKETSLDLRNWVRNFCAHDSLKQIKVVCLVDEEVPLNNPHVLTWIITNNIDPARDAWLFHSGNGTAHLVIDGTRKTSLTGSSTRDWPNIISMDEETIRRIDQIWPNLDLGENIPSPSHSFRKLVKKGGARVED